MAMPVSLPPQPTSLIGRDAEVEAACALLRDPAARLLTFTGPAGVGKTRLAVEVAGRLTDTFANGLVFVDLVPLADAAFVLPAIGRALGLREDPNRAIAEQVAAAVAEQRLLLLLDNVEHVLSAAPSLADLLAACPALTLLATSRSPLRLRWERELPVPPLAVPDAAQVSAGPSVASVPSVALFLERARAVRPSFDLTDETAPAVAAICARLDGLPLAIELIAARVRSFSPSALAAALADDGASPLDLVVGGARDLPARQRTLRDALAWSYDLLSPTEQHTFRQIAVFPASFTVDGAAAVCGGDLRDTLARLAALAALAESNLLVPQTATAEPRFVMLAMVREYGRERLVGAGEEAEAHRRLVAHLLTLAEEAEPHLRSGGREPWLARLDAALDTIRAALAWCERDPASLESGLRLATALEWFWHFRDHWREASERTETLLARAERDGVAEAPRVAAMRVAGRFGVFLGRNDAARMRLEEAAARAGAAGQPLLRALALVFRTRLGWQSEQPRAVALHAATEAVALLREAGDRWWLALALYYLGSSSFRVGDLQAARAAGEEARDIFRESDDSWGIALAEEVIVTVVESSGDWDAARRIVEESLVRRRATGEKLAIATSSDHIGDLARLAGDLDGAGAAHGEALALFRAIGDKGGMARATRGLALVALDGGDLRRSVALFREGLTLLQTLPRIEVSIRFLTAVSELLMVCGRPDAAAIQLGAAASLAAALDFAPGPITRAAIERVNAAARARLAGADFEAAYARGAAGSSAEAIDAAFAAVVSVADHQPPAPHRHARTKSTGELTAREAEIIALLADGWSNREIAEALVISVRTVEHHIARLYAKIGARRRADAAAYAVHHGLARPASPTV